MPLGRLSRLPLAGLRRLRWHVGAWSKDSDRQYHDHLYSAGDYDPFCLDYPGYVTIRRFADHAAPFVPAAGRVLDAGCGPGEITCELARRFPGASFLGVDHSGQAIDRARRNVSRLGLANVEFRAGDAEQLAAHDQFGLVVMFDAFHHMEQPERFLAWMRARTSRCLLIEPAGTAMGRWARNLDLDWLLLDLANVRERLETIVGLDAAIHSDAQPDAGGRTDTPKRGEGAVERRYAQDDFERFFRGWDLSISGTIAGFDRYPPRPHARGPLRRVGGEAVYQFVRATEELLLERGRDGGAKHWVIAASSEPGIVTPRLPRVDPTVRSNGVQGVAGGADVHYVSCVGPDRVPAGSRFHVTVEFMNRGWDTWRSDAENPVFASYHWLDGRGVEVVDFNGARTPLPRLVGPGETCRVQMAVTAPSAPGSSVLAIDLVREGVTWFSETGAPWHTLKVVIEAA